jgi:glutaredoxin
MNKISYSPAQISDLISSFDGFVIVYRSSCPYSQNAVHALEKSGQPLQKFELSQIDASNPKETMINQFKKTISTFPSSHFTVPMIFYKGKFIGGYDQLKSYLRTIQ